MALAPVAVAQITLQITLVVARALHGLDAATDASRALQATAARLGVALRPVHPGVTDPGLVPFFQATVPAGVDAARVLATLRQEPAVEGAYVKPATGLP